MMLCTNVPDLENGCFVCSTCGSRVFQPSRRQCPSGVNVLEAPRRSGAIDPCPHRTAAQRIPGQPYGSCQPVTFYRCDHYGELVQVRRDGDQVKLMTNYPEFRGRLCKDCEPLSDQLPPRTVAVVVTCHNYGRYLRQCLDSILAQDYKPASIVLVDDASEDDTPEIANQYVVRGVRYERVEFRDAVLSRNHGASLSKQPDYWLFVDADNWLPPNYIAELLKHATEPSVGVVYTRLWHVDEQGNSMGWSPQIKQFSLAALRKQNLADTCSLVKRQALDQVQGWKRDRWGLQDWDLWLRIAGAGWQFRYCDSTALNYRIHDKQMTLLNRRKWESGMEVTRDSTLTTIVTLFSGRAWHLGRWFYDLRNLLWNHDNLHLIALDNSRNALFAQDLKDHLETCGLTYTYLQDDSRIVEDLPSHQFTDSARHRVDHVRAMNEHLGRLYSLATRYLPNSTANVWSVEDDVGFPADTLEVLATEAYRLQPAAVCGCLRNRFAGQRILAWTGPNTWVDDVPSQPIRVTGVGLYCMFCRRDAWDGIAWRAGVTGRDKHLYYDWAACHDVQQFGPIYLAPVRCKHYLADGNVLEC